MEKKKMGTDPHNYNSNTHRASSFGSRVAGTGAFNLHSVLKKSGNIILKVGYFFTPTLVFLILLEIVFRMLNLPPYPLHRARYLYVQNDYSNFALHKGFSGVLSNLEYYNQIKVDQLGFRNSHTGEVTIDPQKKRILLSGDSMTFGQGVDYKDSFAGLLANNTEYQVFNSGTPSFGTRHSLGLLKHLGNRINPDVVMYLIYPGNDFYDNKMGFSKIVVKGYLTENSNYKLSTLKDEGYVDYPAYSEKVYLGPIDRFLLNKSFFYRYIRYKGLFLSPIRKIYEEKGIVTVQKCALPYSTSPFSKSYTQEQEYTNTMGVILDMKKYVEEELKTQFVLVHLPIREQIDLKLLEYEKKIGCIKPKDFDLNNPNKFLLNFSKKNNIMFIDATSSLQKSFTEYKNPYYAVDTHLNKQGHIVVSELLNSNIRKIIN